MSVLDPTAPPREGEELDVARLAPWLRHTLGWPEGPLEVSQFPGGHSNLTYLVRVAGAGVRGDEDAGSVSGPAVPPIERDAEPVARRRGRPTHEAVLRRPPLVARIKTAHDMGREYRVLSRLAPVWPRAPRVLAFCEDPSVLGAPFYLMERRAGLILRRDPPPGLAIDEAPARRLSEGFADTLAELHGLDYAAAGLADLGNPEGYVERQVDGWTRRYRDAQTDPLEDMELVAAWLAENRPPLSGVALVHNDFKYDNLVLDPQDLSRVLGVLDWEMATIGDPLLDLGTTLCYWVEADDSPELRALRFGPTTLPGTLSRRELVLRYAQRRGKGLPPMGFYYAFGLFKTAVVAQQLYSRYRRGATSDSRFAGFIQGVRALAGQAVRVLRGAEPL